MVTGLSGGGAAQRLGTCGGAGYDRTGALSEHSTQRTQPRAGPRWWRLIERVIHPAPPGASFRFDRRARRQPKKKKKAVRARSEECGFAVRQARAMLAARSDAKWAPAARRLRAVDSRCGPDKFGSLYRCGGFGALEHRQPRPGDPRTSISRHRDLKGQQCDGLRVPRRRFYRQKKRKGAPAQRGDRGCSAVRIALPSEDPGFWLSARGDGPSLAGATSSNARSRIFGPRAGVDARQQSALRI